MHIFGVFHITGKGQSVVPPSQASYVSRLVKELKQRQVKRFGVETFYDTENYDLTRSSHRFAKALALRASRNNIELVPLEQSLKQKTLVTLEESIVNMLMGGINHSVAFGVLGKSFRKNINPRNRGERILKES